MNKSKITNYVLLTLLSIALVVVGISSRNTNKKVEALQKDVDYAYMLIGTYQKQQEIYTGTIISIISEEAEDFHQVSSKRAFSLIPSKYLESILYSSEFIFDIQ